MRVIFPNFLFEDSISGHRTRRRSQLRDVMNALAPLTGLTGNPGDTVVVAGDKIPPVLPGPLSHVSYTTIDEIQKKTAASSDSIFLSPWGWDSAARLLAKSLGSSETVPSEASVLAVNGRQFLAEFDIMYGRNENRIFNGKFGRLCHDVTTLQEGIAELADQDISQWVAKPAYSASGRGQLSGNSPILNTHQQLWVRRQLGNCGYIYLEPWLPVVRECGIQLHLSSTEPDCSTVRLEGLTEFVTDRQGCYSGSLLTPRHDSLWCPAVAQALHIGKRAKDLGYFGPLGIDCMQVVLPGSGPVLRLCHDINGRMTMGRLALQLKQYLGHENSGVWLHSPHMNQTEVQRSSGKHPANDAGGVVEILRVSPEMIGNQAAAVNSWLYVTDSRDAAENLIRLYRQQSNCSNTADDNNVK